MGWTRKTFGLDQVPVDKSPKHGYSYRLCPYSTAYRDEFRHIGTVFTGIINGVPSSVTGDLVVGNSADLTYYATPYNSYPCSDHATTQGRMVPKSNPPGWLCDDPDCYYFTTVVIGERYKEV
jgi:hypothetical protein